GLAAAVMTASACQIAQASMCALRASRTRYPLPLRVDASVASGRVRGSSQQPPHPPRAFGARHPLPQGERVTEFASRSSLHSMDGAKRALVQQRKQHGQHTLDVTQHIVVPEPLHEEIVRSQPAISLFVVLRLRMLAAI